MKYIFTILFVFTLLVTGRTQSSKPVSVVATTSWTAAYALAAGVDNVIVLAPFEMVHPSEYELKPGDISKLNNSNLIVYAGYEVIVNQIKDGLNIPDSKLVKIMTSFNYHEIAQSVMLIASKIGTEKIAIENLKQIKESFDQGKAEILKSNLIGKAILVHFFQESFVKELGLNPIKIFGPAPLEPRQILEMAKSDATLIVDNAHSPVGAPMKEILKNGAYKLLLNFPGTHQTRTINDVIRYNTNQLTGR